MDYPTLLDTINIQRGDLVLAKLTSDITDDELRDLVAHLATSSGYRRTLLLFLHDGSGSERAAGSGRSDPGGRSGGVGTKAARSAAAAGSRAAVPLASAGGKSAGGKPSPEKRPRQCSSLVRSWCRVGLATAAGQWC